MRSAKMLLVLAGLSACSATGSSTIVDGAVAAVDAATNADGRIADDAAPYQRPTKASCVYHGLFLEAGETASVYPVAASASCGAATELVSCVDGVFTGFGVGQDFGVPTAPATLSCTAYGGGARVGDPFRIPTHYSAAAPVRCTDKPTRRHHKGDYNNVIYDYESGTTTYPVNHDQPFPYFSYGTPNWEHPGFSHTDVASIELTDYPGYQELFSLTFVNRIGVYQPEVSISPCQGDFDSPDAIKQFAYIDGSLTLASYPGIGSAAYNDALRSKIYNSPHQVTSILPSNARGKWFVNIRPRGCGTYDAAGNTWSETQNCYMAFNWTIAVTAL